jgi:hypothetical protein
MIHTSQARIVPAAESLPPAGFSRDVSGSRAGAAGPSPASPVDPRALTPIGPLEPVENPEILFEVQCEAMRYCW